MAIIRRVSVLLLILSLASCLNTKPPEPEGFLLGDLVPIHVSATQDVVKVPTDELIVSYRDLLKHVDDPEIVGEVTGRIAVLELLLQDQLQEHSEDKGDGSYVADYSMAIDAFNDALTRFPDRPNNDELYYQLAKAHDLSGQPQQSLAALTELVTRYPSSPYFVEAQFRRGDHLFSLGQFKPAQDAYQAVLDGGEYTPFYENAVYMHGWSLFKRNFYEPSIVSFTRVLDRTMPASGDIDGVVKTKAALVEDSLRIMGIIFSYLDGGETITATYEELGPRAYEGLLYERLGDLYVSQERYQDAIATFKAYMTREPMGDKVPELHNKVLATMMKAKYFNKAFEEKEQFIESYNTTSNYFAQASDERKQYILDYLYVYVDEVARFYHARAQKAKKDLRYYKVPPPGRKKKMLDDYKTATLFYQRFIDAFPDDIHAAEKSFMMGEALSEIGDYPAAIKAYERTAYDFGINNFSEDAAYASVLGYRKLLKDEKDADKKARLVQQKLSAQKSFTDMYGFSQYTRPILLDSIDTLYSDKQFEEAAAEAQRFLELDPPGTEKEQEAVWLVLGHSRFELKKYAEAEVAYNKVLEFKPKAKKRREIINRIAACVYRQGEALVAEDKKLEAVEQFLRVAKVAPNSKFRKNAEYDAATYLLQAEKWERSLEVLADYRKRYDPKRESLDISSKILAAYEGLGKFELAAKELLRVTNLSKDPEKKRQALFLSAEYYEKAGNNAEALKRFRTYSHQYPEPFDLAMETRYRLSEMYRKLKDDNRRRYWLEKIIKYDREAGEKRTDRSKYLAALSRNVFAEDYRKAFEKIKLTLPLKDSLARKKKALEDALLRYQKILDYQVQDFSTQSTYYVANIYAQLSTDLMDSERPRGLNELELEQYTILLEEQAYPFEESAIEIHESNVQNSWNGSFDEWVGRSIESLAKLLPGRYNKKEELGEYSDVIY